MGFDFNCGGPGEKIRRPVLKESCFVKHTRTGSARSDDKLFSLHFNEGFFSFLSWHTLIISAVHPLSKKKGPPLAGFIVCFIIRPSVSRVGGCRLATLPIQEGRDFTNLIDKTSRVRKGNLFLLALFHIQLRRCRVLHGVPAIHDLIQSRHHSLTESSKTRGQTLPPREMASWPFLHHLHSPLAFPRLQVQLTLTLQRPLHLQTHPGQILIIIILIVITIIPLHEKMAEDDTHLDKYLHSCFILHHHLPLPLYPIQSQVPLNKMLLSSFPSLNNSMGKWMD